jgi:superfamily I DNA/RNA helicase
MYDWTEHQEQVINAVQQAVLNNDKNELIKISAVAGSAKSTTMIEATKRIYNQLPTLKARYLVFNSAMATEAKHEYGTMAIVSTLHSLAYHYTVKPFKLNPQIASFITWKDIPNHIRIPYGRTPLTLQILNDYFDSEYTSFQPFLDATIDTYFEQDESLTTQDYFLMVPAMNQILDSMASGKMKCTHNFYLKLFHILVLNGQIKLDPIDLLIVDEVQDLTPITLDIINAFPAKVKALVGDPAQAIYQFMGCTSAFDYYQSKGISYTLPKSFRVSNNIARYVESFCQTYLDPKMEFKGMSYKQSIKPKTKAYIARTNNAIIAKMIELNSLNVPYKLATSTKVKQMFELPTTLIQCTPGGKIYNKDLQIIQHAIDAWDKLPEDNRPSRLGFISNYCNNPQITNAIKLIAQHGPNTILETARLAEEHKKSSSNLTILTSHTSKGLTFDEVELANDLNEAITELVELDPASYTDEERAELYLYYVACTRARYKLHNAKHLIGYQS